MKRLSIGTIITESLKNNFRIHSEMNGFFIFSKKLLLKNFLANKKIFLMFLYNIKQLKFILKNNFKIFKLNLKNYFRK